MDGGGLLGVSPASAESHCDGFLANFLLMGSPFPRMSRTTFVHAGEHSQHLLTWGQTESVYNTPEFSPDFFWTTTSQILWQNSLNLSFLGGLLLVKRNCSCIYLLLIIILFGRKVNDLGKICPEASLRIFYSNILHILVVASHMVLSLVVQLHGSPLPLFNFKLTSLIIF